MNKYVRMIICVPFGILKLSWTKLFHISKFNASLVCAISPFSEITMDRYARAKMGKRFRMRGGSHIRVRNGAKLEIGDNVSVNHNCMIVCREAIQIGNDVQFSPNVFLYDHDFRFEGGVKSMKFKTSPIKIGNNVWIGANTVILRGTEIGDNSVIAAGSVVKGSFPQNSLIYQKRKALINEIITDA